MKISPRLSVCIALLWTGLAYGANTAAQAEHERLSDEIEKLVQRQVWSGVERKYQDLEQLGVELTQQDLLNGAYAARELGDVLSAYERLYRAKEIKPTKEILNWLYDIDTHYGHVELMTVPNRSAELVLEVMPFDINQRKAVERAIAASSADGHYIGLIPKGSYVFAGQQFTVEPGVSVRIEVSPRTRRQGLIDPVIIYRDLPGGTPTDPSSSSSSDPNP